MNKLFSKLLGRSPLADVQARIESEQATLRKYASPLHEIDLQCAEAAKAFFADPAVQKFEKWIALETRRDAARRMTQDVAVQMSQIRSRAIHAAIPTMEATLTELIEGLQRRRAEVVAEDQRESIELGVDATRVAVLAAIDRQIERLETRRFEMNRTPEAAFNIIVSEFSQ